ncbi:MAG: barstar family protein [Atopobiaceae bacterium]|jgi:RNAse (barnase) inhibitor barstar|nr:barstar family protein [Atopobiaceae bacterium]
MKIRISEADTLAPDDVWDLLSESFGFPSWFGRNFAALSDLLEDVAVPAELDIVLDSQDEDLARHRFFAALAKVASRAAEENPILQVAIYTV